MQFLVRIVIAAVVYVIVVLWIIPALFAAISMPESGPLLILIKGVGILLACGYIIWGPPVPRVL